MRMIDADAFFNDFPEMRDYEYASQEYEVDAVEIVRCVDCEYAETYVYQGEVCITCNNNEGLYRDVPNDGYCYVGRKWNGKSDD